MEGTGRGDEQRKPSGCGIEVPLALHLVEYDVSESMSPAFERGDILFLTMFWSDPIAVGDIVVFNIKGRDIPIVHRVLKVHEEYGNDGALSF